MSAAMELHVALSMRLDAVEAYRLAHAYRDEVLAKNGDAVERDCLAMAVLFARQWSGGTPFELHKGIDEILATMPATGEKATAPAATATPQNTVFDPLPSYLHAIGQAGSETERALHAAYVQAITEVTRLQAQTDDSQPSAGETTAGPTGRVAQLLDAIRTAHGRWTTVTAFRFYRDHLRDLDHIPNTQLRAVARGGLRDLAVWGHLLRHEEPGRQYYTLKTRKDRTS